MMNLFYCLLSIKLLLFCLLIHPKNHQAQMTELTLLINLGIESDSIRDIDPGDAMLFLWNETRRLFPSNGLVQAIVGPLVIIKHDGAIDGDDDEAWLIYAPSHSLDLAPDTKRPLVRALLPTWCTRLIPSLIYPRRRFEVGYCSRCSSSAAIVPHPLHHGQQFVVGPCTRP